MTGGLSVAESEEMIYVIWSEIARRSLNPKQSRVFFEREELGPLAAILRRRGATFIRSAGSRAVGKDRKLRLIDWLREAERWQRMG